MKYLLNLPKTTFAQSLGLDWAEIDRSLQMVYKKTADNDGNGGDYLFAGEYFPDNDAIGPEEEALIVPVSSVLVNTPTWSSGTQFANILHSSGDDPHDQSGKSKSWHDLMNAAGISWNCHAETDQFYDCFTGIAVTSTAGKSYTCDSTIIGGHVLLGQRPSTAMRGGTVYVVPICHNHNSKVVSHTSPEPTPGNGNGFFMKLSSQTKVLEMTGYLPRNVILPLLANAQILK